MRAPDALTTCPVNELVRRLPGPAWLAAVARTISAASTTVNADAAIQKRPVARILFMSPTPFWVIILLALGHQNGATGMTKTNDSDQWLASSRKREPSGNRSAFLGQAGGGVA